MEVNYSERFTEILVLLGAAAAAGKHKVAAVAAAAAAAVMTSEFSSVWDSPQPAGGGGWVSRSRTGPDGA